MITLFLLVVAFAASITYAQFDPNCNINGPAATFYHIDTNGKEVITDGSTLDASKTTFFIIHGWNKTSTSDQYEDIGRQLSASGNAILVDYSNLALKFYGTCAYYIVDTLGGFVAKFIKQQTDAGSMNPSRIHIDGHSIGGQAAGKVGREVKKLTGTQIKRISGLDPAGPFFSLLIVHFHLLSLGPYDAEMIDVLHTSVLYGSLGRMNTVDFFARNWLGVPNIQPECGLHSTTFCSHQMNKKYFLEAINSCGFIATSDSLLKETKMISGMHMPLNASGSFSFTANNKPNYAKGNPECPILYN